jgi:hypothetical protein
MNKVKLSFMVVPEDLMRYAYVPNAVKVKIVDAEAIFLLGILGESGRKLVKAGIHVDYQLKFYGDALKKEGLNIDKAIAYPIEEEDFEKKIDKATINIKSNKEVSELLDRFNECVKSKKYLGTKKGSQFCKACPYKAICKYYNKERK